VTFGNSKSTLRAAKAVRKVHSRIKGTYPEDIGSAYPAGMQYDARDEASVKWVFATLIETAEFVNSFMLGELSQQVVSRRFISLTSPLATRIPPYVGRPLWELNVSSPETLCFLHLKHCRKGRGRVIPVSARSRLQSVGSESHRISRDTLRV
jgi:hypothetical protein